MTVFIWLRTGYSNKETGNFLITCVTFGFSRRLCSMESDLHPCLYNSFLTYTAISQSYDYFFLCEEDEPICPLQRWPISRDIHKQKQSLGPYKVKILFPRLTITSQSWVNFTNRMEHDLKLTATTFCHTL
jgi:hypothetical protein